MKEGRVEGVASQCFSVGGVSKLSVRDYVSCGELGKYNSINFSVGMISAT